VATGVGLACASGSWALIAIAGLGLILSHITWLDAVLRVVGAVDLIWLGMKMILRMIATR
jgi:threonine efflux protein